MNASGLFDFRFVDRNEEQKSLNNFFQNVTKQTLWIKGNSGFGKTTFFNFVYNSWENYCLCYINIKNDSTASDILKSFILELQKYSDIDFLSMVKKEYKKFYNTFYKNSKEITNDLFPNISNMVSTILDVTYTAITLSDKQVNSEDTLVQYIRSILSNKKLCICIDNFSRCDLETAEHFFNIFKHFYDNANFKSCIITTSEDISENLQRAIFSNLPYKEIKINNFDNYIYFTEILDPIFDLKNFEASDIEYLYKKCNGSPKILSTVISKLLEKDGITIRNNIKANIDKKMLFSILQSEYIQFDASDFTTAQKWIIFSYLCLNEKTDVQMLEDLGLFIASKIYLLKTYNKITFYKELQNLIDNKILLYNSDNTISPIHDIDYRDLENIFENSPFRPMFSQYAYEFLNGKKTILEKQKLLCKLARNAEIVGWEHLNFRYGKMLARNKQYYDAQKVFSCLSASFNKLNIMNVIFIAINSYRTGEYNLAIEEFNTIDWNELQYNKVKFYYLFYIGKSYNNIGRTKQAAETLEEALKYVETNSREYVQTLNVLHMYYFEINDTVDKSKKYFNIIKNEYREMFPDIWANTMRGCHNFLKFDDAINVLCEAERLLNDELEIAYIKTTKGFLYAKNDQLSDAKEIFYESSRTIKKLRLHEYSYAANNYAICCMLEQNYQEAIEVLQEALLWNRTEYGNIVLQNHLMVCTLYLNQEQETERYYSFLKNYVEKYSQIDTIMKRKLYINLAIVSNELNLEIDKNSYLKQCESLVKGTSSEWRYYYLLNNNSNNNPIPRPKEQCSNTLYFDPWFLVYAHD